MSAVCCRPLVVREQMATATATAVAALGAQAQGEHCLTELAAPVVVAATDPGDRVRRITAVAVGVPLDLGWVTVALAVLLAFNPTTPPQVQGVVELADQVATPLNGLSNRHPIMSPYLVPGAARVVLERMAPTQARFPLIPAMRWDTAMVAPRSTVASLLPYGGRTTRL